MTTIDYHLGDSSITLLHRAGLAGLWMTLKQLEIEKVQTIQGLKWELRDRAITLSWDGKDIDVLDWLLKEAYQLDDGLIALRGLDSKTMNLEVQVTMHQGILGTFLQHTSTHKSKGVVPKSFLLEDNKPEILVKHKVLNSYVYQTFAKNLCDKKGSLSSKPISVAGWLSPGAVVKHTAFSSNTSFEELPEQALLLLFAPVACCYYSLRSQLRDKRAQYALVIPEITNLRTYAEYRQSSNFREAGYLDFCAYGLGDAGLRFLTQEKASEKVGKCQVITLGTVAWSSQQKTRTGLYVVEPDYQVCQTYEACKSHLSDRVVESSNGTFIPKSLAREFIAENLARNKPWYSGISDVITSNELFNRLTYEREGLNQMVKETEWDTKDEKLFVEACHEAISYTYGQLASYAQKRGEVPNFDRETVKIRTSLGRCKNAETFREFISSFFAKAGKIPTLQEHWTELMNMILCDWKKSRDLALLALASYKGKGLQEDDPIDI
ncbi:type I-MYXAN CRISPR-associated Cas8a1/Cmx1 [Lusitaniella coriacea]|uniref:type I-MYXAN CRISPR-associated Cas8a1/Cmx1 n=1 Tax=Lusitaniella coriacea TaxID=1983105 RepID=UPI003CF889B8